MIVLDASALAEALLTTTPSAVDLRQRLAAEPIVVAPDLIDVETGAVLRRQWLTGRVTEQSFRTMLDELGEIPIVRYPTRQFLGRAYELRHNVTIADAMYIALAEGLRCPLVTGDARLAEAPGIRCTVEVLTD
jgi:predicted nucleic acid-binding protein